MAKNLKDFLTKKYDKSGSVGMLDKIEFLDTGIPTVNYVLSGLPLTGGLPLSGKMTMIYGPEGAGKTSLVNQIISMAQKKNYSIVYIDTERSITVPRIKQFGIDPDGDSFTYATPEYIEEVFDIIENTCAYKLSGSGDDASTNTLVVWDSIAGTPAKATLERKPDDVEMGVDAKALTRGLKRVRGKVKNSNVGVLFVNQARANLSSYGDTFVIPGGYALKHMVDLVVRVNKLKVGKDTTGQIIKFSTPDKNRMFRPFQATEVFFDFDTLFNKESIVSSFVDLLVNIGMIGMSGSWCYSMAEVQEMMRNDPKLEETEAIKKANKFYRAKYAETLIKDEAEYNKQLKMAEDFIQRNIALVTERAKDPEAEKIAKHNKNNSEDYEGQAAELEE